MAGPTASSKPRKHRGPAKVIPLPAKEAPRTNGKPKTKQQKGKARARRAQREDDADPDAPAHHTGDEEDDDAHLEDAEEMVDYSSDSSGSSSSEHKPEHKAKSKAGSASKPSAPNMKFLTSMDVNAISLSRAEIARRKKEEQKAQRDELKMAQKLAQKDKKAAHQQDSGEESGEDAYETEFEDEDLGSDLDGDEDFDSDVDVGSDVYEYSDGAESDSQASAQSEEESESDASPGGEPPELDEEAREDALIRQRAAQAKRKRKEDEAASAKLAKRARLPVRGDTGWEDKLKEASDAESEADRDPRHDKVVRKPTTVSDSDSEEEEEDEETLARKAAKAMPKTNITTGSRFGLLAPYAVVRLESRSQRVGAAREQIARLAQTIMADPEEGSIGLVRRLLVFARPAIRPPKVAPGAGVPGIEADPDKARKLKPIPVEASIRAAAVLSLMAVFGDVLPGYRIRPLTDQEKNESVSQEVRRRRDFEQGIIEVYRDFLELCEELVKDHTSDLMPIAVRALTTLLLREPQFNYRTNIIRVVVACLSRPSWTPVSEMCASTCIELLKGDQAGEISLEVVRLLHRMIKERRYQVHAAVLDILLHLRLKDELGNTRASTTTSDLPKNKKLKAGQLRKSEGHALSKKEVKRQRELREIEKEMAEADAEVNKEERARHVSFVLCVSCAT